MHAHNHHPRPAVHLLQRIPFEAWVAVVYAATAALWIYYSDRLVGLLAQSPQAITAWSIYKGWGYVLVTALLLFGVLRGNLNRIRHARRQLEENETYLRNLLNFSPSPVAIMRLDGTSEFLNRKFTRIFGYSVNDLPDLHQWIQPVAPPASPGADPLDSWVLDIVAAHQAGREPSPLEARLVGRQGNVRAVILHAAIIHDRIFIIINDITERKQAEQALSDELRRKDEFIAILSHELRNPLAPIVNAVAVMRLAGHNEATLARQQAIIERQVRHISHLLDDLLDLARITRGAIHLHPCPVDLREAAEQAIETTLIEEGPRADDFHRDFPNEPVMVQGDLTRLVQVIGNLLSNAIKYSEKGQAIRLVVAREPAADPSQTTDGLVRVEDQGMGIAPALLPHIFDLFVQADQSLDRTRGGLGIGLTLTRRIVELHGGRIEAWSPGLGRGSVFTVHIPPAHSVSEEATPCQQATRGDSKQDEGSVSG